MAAARANKGTEYNTVVAAHPNDHVVYVTHNFLTNSGTLAEGCGPAR